MAGCSFAAYHFAFTLTSKAFKLTGMHSKIENPKSGNLSFDIWGRRFTTVHGMIYAFFTVHTLRHYSILHDNILAFGSMVFEILPSEMVKFPQHWRKPQQYDITELISLEILRVPQITQLKNLDKHYPSYQLR
jgi:hypothetical protein